MLNAWNACHVIKIPSTSRHLLNFLFHEVFFVAVHLTFNTVEYLANQSQYFRLCFFLNSVELRKSKFQWPEYWIFYLLWLNCSPNIDGWMLQSPFLRSSESWSWRDFFCRVFSSVRFFDIFCVSVVIFWGFTCQQKKNDKNRLLRRNLQDTSLLLIVWERGIFQQYLFKRSMKSHPLTKVS